jgi:hypothetical protein
MPPAVPVAKRDYRRSTFVWYLDATSWVPSCSQRTGLKNLMLGAAALRPAVDGRASLLRFLLDNLGKLS